MDVRRNENYRESWYITNNSSNNITIGDLLLLPALQSGKTVDALKFYTREKISHSVILTQLVKSGIISLSKQKIFGHNPAGTIAISEIDAAISPAEEDELTSQISTEDEITDDTDGILLYGKNPNDKAQPIGISGEENNEVMTMDIDLMTTLEDIYIELIKANIQLSIITGNEIRHKEINMPIQE